MHVCDLTTLYLDGGQGGVNTYLEEKARYFATLPDVRHTIVVPGRRTERRRLFDSDLYTLKAPPLPSNPQHRVLTRVAEVQRILREARPSVVEVDCAYLLGRVAASELGGRDVPVVGFYHVHLPTFIARPSAARFSSRLAAAAEHWAWRYVDFCYKHCDRLIVSSPDMQARLSERGFTRLECLSLGVNRELFRPPATPRDPNAPHSILYVGRLSREKELDVLMEAFQLLTPRASYRLEIVGDGPTRGRLERAANGDPRITFWGALPYGDQLVERYAAADLVAMPSPNETFSLTTLEAFAAGLPVVAINRGGPVNLVRPDTGELARPHDAADFAAKLEHVAKHVGDYTGGRAHVEANYSWERTFTRLLEIYADARGRRSIAG